MELTANSPELATQSTAPQPTPAAAPATGTKIQVLAIDDNDDFRSLVKQLLEPLGFEVTGCANPVKALELFTRDKTRYELVLVDYYMPQLDGAKTFEWLRRINPYIKIIIVSGADELRLRQILAQHPIDGYLRKPFRVQEAVQIIRHVLARPVRQ